MKKEGSIQMDNEDKLGFCVARCFYSDYKSCLLGTFRKDGPLSFQESPIAVSLSGLIVPFVLWCRVGVCLYFNSFVRVIVRYLFPFVK